MREQVAALMNETEEKLARYLEALENNEPFDMAGFDALVAEVQEKILKLPTNDAASFQGQMGGIIEKLDKLAKALEARRDQVQAEIKGLSRQQAAQAAYRKADDTK